MDVTTCPGLRTNTSHAIVDHVGHKVQQAL